MRFDLERSRIGRAVMNPLTVLMIFLVASVSAGVAFYALYTSTQENARATATARSEATAAVHRSEIAQAKAQLSSALALESARLEFCQIVGIYANAHGPTNPRGQEISTAWAALGKSTFLHCDH